jgi:hypothetical protein
LAEEGEERIQSVRKAAADSSRQVTAAQVGTAFCKQLLASEPSSSETRLARLHETLTSLALLRERAPAYLDPLRSTKLLSHHAQRVEETRAGTIHATTSTTMAKTSRQLCLADLVPMPALERKVAQLLKDETGLVKLNKIAEAQSSSGRELTATLQSEYSQMLDAASALSMPPTLPTALFDQYSEASSFVSTFLQALMRAEAEAEAEAGAEGAEGAEGAQGHGALQILELKNFAATVTAIIEGDVKLRGLQTSFHSLLLSNAVKLGAVERCLSRAQDAVDRLRTIVSQLFVAVNQQEEHLSDIGILRDMPASYVALAEEEKRRLSYGAAVGASARGALQLFERMRKEEHDARTAFALRHGSLLPRALLDGVDALPVTFRLVVDDDNNAFEDGDGDGEREVGRQPRFHEEELGVAWAALNARSTGQETTSAAQSLLKEGAVEELRRENAALRAALSSLVAVAEVPRDVAARYANLELAMDRVMSGNGNRKEGGPILDAENNVDDVTTTPYEHRNGGTMPLAALASSSSSSSSSSSAAAPFTSAHCCRIGCVSDCEANSFLLSLHDLVRRWELSADGPTQLAKEASMIHAQLEGGGGVQTSVTSAAPTARPDRGRRIQYQEILDHVLHRLSSARDTPSVASTPSQASPLFASLRDSLATIIAREAETQRAVEETHRALEESTTNAKLVTVKLCTSFLAFRNFTPGCNALFFPAWGGSRMGGMLPLGGGRGVSGMGVSASSPHPSYVAFEPSGPRDARKLHISTYADPTSIQQFRAATGTRGPLDFALATIVSIEERRVPPSPSPPPPRSRRHPHPHSHTVTTSSRESNADGSDTASISAVIGTPRRRHVAAPASASASSGSMASGASSGSSWVEGGLSIHSNPFGLPPETTYRVATIVPIAYPPHRSMHTLLVSNLIRSAQGT